MSRIIQAGDERLRTASESVAQDSILSPEIQSIISDLKTAMHSQKDAVAIAAPQIGINKRIFLVAAKAMNTTEDLVCINPEIIRLSRKKEPMEEGCLSVRWKYGKVNRAKKATIEATDEFGIRFEMGGSGLLSQIFQHEMDHLEGILFIDKAHDVRDEDGPTNNT